jgi:hypothetical protein
MSNQAEFKLKYTIESDNSKAKKDVQEVDTLISKLFGKKTASSGLQSSFKEVASEVSNIVSELTGDRLSGAASQVTSLANAFGAIPGPGRSRHRCHRWHRDSGGRCRCRVVRADREISGVWRVHLQRTGQDRTAREHFVGSSSCSKAKRASSLTRSQIPSRNLHRRSARPPRVPTRPARSLIALGLDPKKAADNLDESLDKVLKKIADAPTIVEKNTLAFQAFGKQGKELLPFIERFHGDLPELTAELEKMGVTIGDKDALAAHVFGEEMSLVTNQIEKTAIKIGSAFMPVFNQMATGVSNWVAKNQNEIVEWADKFAFGLDRVVKGAGIVIGKLEEYYTAYHKFMTGIGLGFVFAIPDTLNADYKADFSTHSHESTGYNPGLPTGGLPDVYGKGAKKPPKESDDQFRKFFEEQGFHVTRTFGDELNKGSLHPLGLAADVSVRGKTEDEIANACRRVYRKRLSAGRRAKENSRRLSDRAASSFRTQRIREVEHISGRVDVRRRATRLSAKPRQSPSRQRPGRLDGDH